jgi:dihydroorotate dehydrogenase (NAD+) catalytic subunit
MVWEAARAVSIPVIGIGGITSGEDVAEFLIAGARAVQIGTATFVQPAATLRILGEFINFCNKNKIEHAKELSGTLKSS